MTGPIIFCETRKLTATERVYILRSIELYSRRDLGHRRVSMQKKTLSLLALTFLLQVVVPGATCQAQAQAAKASYPAMAPLDQYLMPDQNSEIALARTAAPPSISDAAEVMVLG